jgi:hypothetical protein
MMQLMIVRSATLGQSNGHSLWLGALLPVSSSHVACPGHDVSTFSSHSMMCVACSSRLLSAVIGVMIKLDPRVGFQQLAD